MCVTYFLGFLRALLTWIMAVLVLFVLLRVSHVAVAIRILSQWRRTWRGGGGGDVKRGWRTRHETRGVLIVARSSCCACVVVVVVVVFACLGQKFVAIAGNGKGEHSRQNGRRAGELRKLLLLLLVCFFVFVTY